MTLITEPLEGGATMVRPALGQRLLDLPDDELQSLMRSAGALIFRGFGADSTQMKAFADRFSSGFNRDRLRVPVEGTNGEVQMVTEGMGYIEPHSEQANSPFRPDAIWFCCGIPAEQGGETLFWDGVRIWQALSPELKRLFGAKKLRFFQRYSAAQWGLFLGEGSTLEDVHRILEGKEGVFLHVNADQSIYFEYLCSAVVKTKYCGEDAFANGLLTEQRNTLGGLMTFEDGTPILERTIREIEDTVTPLTQVIRWQKGDLVFLDNSRFMHGRTAFTDTRRRVFSCMSFLNF